MTPSLTQEDADVDEQLLKAADAMMNHAEDENVHDPHRAGELMNKYMEKYDVAMEGDSRDGDDDDYTKVTQKEVLIVMQAAQDTHDHHLGV